MPAKSNSASKKHPTRDRQSGPKITKQNRHKQRVEDEEPNRHSALKRLIFGEEKPDLRELEAGSTTILDILSPTAVDTKSRDYIVVDGVFHA